MDNVYSEVVQIASCKKDTGLARTNIATWRQRHSSNRMGPVALVILVVTSITTFLLLFCPASVQTAQGEGKASRQAQQTPGLTLTHTSNVTSTSFHGVIEYQVVIHNSMLFTVTDLALLITRPTPNDTSYLTTTLTASHGYADYTPDQQAIHWTGDAPPQSNILISFAVQLTRFTTCKTLYSQALLQAPDLPETLLAVAKVEYHCPRIEKLQFTIRADLTETVPGNVIAYQLAITNASDLPTNELQIVNPILIGATYLVGSATATSTTFSYDPTFKELTWAGVLPERSTWYLHFQTKVRERVRCGTVLTNNATIYNSGLMLPSNPTIQALTTITCTESQPWTDFGDAPDSDSNHHGMNNTAYVASNVLGHFPTVWEGTPANEASGPTHRPDYFWLGDEISAEVDADLNLDAGAIAHGRDFTNILHNGQEDVADWEFEDDGWRNPSVPMLNCEKPTLLVRIRRADVPTPVERLWLNVWFDGNRDGDWQDSGDCPGSADPLGGKSFEWVVQDWVIYPDQIPPDGFLDLQIPTKLIYNPTPASLVWVRFTLSEQRALRPTIGSLADGRGPAHPAFFQVGETEDYLVDGLLQGEPVQVSLYHETDFVITPTVRIGNKVEFYTILEPTTGVAPATLVMQNNLPAEVTLVGYPAFNVLSRPDDYVGTDDGVTPLVATFLPNEGPSGRIEWRGQLRREVVIRISYTVEVRACPPPDANGQHPLRSVAQVRQPDGAIVSAEAAYLVDCTPTAVGAARLFLPLVNK